MLILNTITPVPISFIGYVNRKPTWELLTDVSIQDSDTHILARKGFKFDLASIPRIVWPIISPFDLSIVAPLFHDLIYEYKGYLPTDCVYPYKTFTRYDADNLFLRLMKVEKIPMFKRNLAYYSVRLYGGIYWNT